MYFWLLIGNLQSHDFFRAYSLFVAQVASFAPKWNEGATDATIRDTKKLVPQQKSCDYIIIIIITQGQIIRGVLERAVCYLAACSDNNSY